MKTTATSIGHKTLAADLRTCTAIGAVLLATASLVACGPEGGGMAVDGGTFTGPDSSATGPDDATTMDVPRQSAAEDGGQQPVPPNQTCTVGAQCASGFCVDGVCCNKVCDGSCESCALTGKVGTCSPIKNATDDSCGGDSICDATGACHKLLGKVCSFASECSSGNCVDGVCCASAGCGSCQACAVLGSEGTCAPVPRFMDDADSGCSGESTCDGLGQCRSKNGTECGASAECTSLQCVDGVCCNEACDGTCYSCNQPGHAGTCTPLNGAEDPSAKVACTGSGVCSAAAGATPTCKIRDGQPCTSSTDCLNGSCVTSYRDADGDGYGKDKVTRCERATVTGYVTTGGDCCDSDAAAHPGVNTYSAAATACGGFDRNCDGRVEMAAGGMAPSCGCVFEGIGGKLGGTLICTACR